MSESVDPKLVAQILIAASGKPLETTFDCGCEVGVFGDAFMMRPCSPTCEKYLYTKEKARELGKTLQYAFDGSPN